MTDYIITRRSTRKFAQDRAVPAELIEKVVEAGRYAPTGGNSQTTHFLVIQDKQVLADLAAMVQKSFAAMEVTPGMYKSIQNSINASKRGNYVFHYNPSALIVTANQKDYGNNMADCACALENMMIQANMLDLGTCYINQLKWLNEDPDILAYLHERGLGENERVYAALAVGYADTEDGLPNRNPLPRTGNPVTYL